MTYEMKNGTNRYEKAHKRRRFWHRVISFLSAITVFITTYALILPALTMEPSAGIKMDNVFIYEDEDVYIHFYVSGRAAFASDDEAVKNAVKEKVELTVNMLEEDSAIYGEYAKYAGENIGEENLYRLLAMDLQFTYENHRLNVDECEIGCEIVAKESMVGAGVQTMNLLQDSVSLMLSNGTDSSTDEQENTAEEEKKEVLALTVLQGVSETLENRNTAYLEEGNEVMTLDTSLSGQTMALALYATTNPSFTVQYYSHKTAFDSDGDASIAVLDNSNATLAQNGKTYTVGNGLVNAHLNKIAGTNKYEMAIHQELVPMYTSQNYEYVKAPGVAYIDRNRDSGNFKLYQVWVLKDGKSAASVKESDWTIYGGDVKFTNRAESASSTRIHITEGMTIRLVYNEVDGRYVNYVQFYDYDITDGNIHNTSGTQYNTNKQTNSATWLAATYNEGINKFTAASGTVKLAFGNVNTGTAYGKNSWNGNLLNMYNKESYKGCTFGMVTGMNADGTLKYASGISAPILFTDAQQVGKTVLNGYTLEFDRSGDTYFLTTVKTESGKIAADDLDHFTNPSYGTTVHDHIFTNNFWPMDASPTWGAVGHDLKFGNYTLQNYRKFFRSNSTFSSTQGTFPISDDGVDHNSYFGMNYEVNFTLSEDYIGALEYVFYGDDDMWVFLDGTLICDIGGVHSSVGQYVDLWPYINKMVQGDKYGEHTLSFYYTERGASGSTCFMAFTLPSVSTDTPQMESANLTLGKQVINGNNEQEFEFTVTLKDEAGNAILDDYSYTKFNSENVEQGTYIFNKDENVLTLSHGEYVVLNYLPKGTQYTIYETKAPGYHTVYTVNGGANNEGNTVSGALTESTEILYINSSGLLLPATGGQGRMIFYIPILLAGASLIILPIANVLHDRRKKRI